MLARPGLRTYGDCQDFFNEPGRITGRLKKQMSLLYDVLRNRVATADVDFKFGVNRHSGSRCCYAATRTLFDLHSCRQDSTETYRRIGALQFL